MLKSEKIKSVEINLTSPLLFIIALAASEDDPTWTTFKIHAISVDSTAKNPCAMNNFTLKSPSVTR